jgi:hypothetical protein
MNYVLAFFTAVTEVFKAINTFLPDLVNLFRSIAAYYEAKRKREEDAIKTEIEQRLKACENQARREAANYRAHLATLNASWKQILEQVIAHIKNGQEENVLAMIGGPYNEKVNSILFDMSKTPEVRAGLIVDIMEKQ